MRFWHWLCIFVFPDFVWYRWYGQLPQDPAAVLTSPMTERFLGTSSLNGVSRNSLARLYWCAAALHTEEDGYRYVIDALTKQDLFQAIFERKFGLYQPAAKACLEEMVQASEQEWRVGVRRLNHYLTTSVVEILSKEEVKELLTA
jgi:hypothetical protein